MNTNDTIYAVTDQHILLTLTVVEADSNIEDLDGWTKVTTKLADENPKRHAVSHHKAYFADFFLDEDGVASRSGIYTSKANAIDAIQATIAAELAALDRKRESLLAKQAAMLEVANNG